VSAGWVAGSVRARLLLRRRLGRDGARALAAQRTLEEAVAALGATPYARATEFGSDLEGAQRAVAAAALLEIRLLAGWLPRGAAELIRSLAAWFELANVEDRLAYLLGSEARQPFELGVLASAWPRVALAQTPAEVRAALGASAWGDPGSDDSGPLHLALRIAWARRALTHVPEARAWVAGALAILVAREAFVAGRSVAELRLPHLVELGPRWRQATTLDSLRLGLDPRAAWALAGVADAGDLWRAEPAWWLRVEADGEAFARGPREGRGVVVGAVALIGLDALRTTAALAVAARSRSPGSTEALDALL
jgi:hypothetical protein